ncbi:MAG: hypothetical protein A2086_02720 [Spirochaetes bacterium GWD1_27_9]|nr:MAG: hypothetical protein A2Z98_14610 [Spirochaetes bacterium GWB1_27_13]OHD26766.1 MAG: hypothetical protein A2Y34_02935 [Spirochaetes bacterium GWC1_27_15]OHD31539.1 MAG: hypothetical protein A2086_02720 [Spirochaetes bacterium GWD1_27_9]
MNEVSRVFKNTRFDSNTLIIFLIVIGVIIVGFSIRYIIVYFIKSGELKRFRNSMKKEILGTGFEFNFIEKKILYDIIDEFKRSDILANQIQTSVLERYSEYFFNNLQRLKISKKEAEKLRDIHYPILTESNVELEIFQDNQLFIFESKVISVLIDNIVIKYIETSFNFQIGTKVRLNYHINNKFISGECKITNVVEDKKIVLTYPKKFVLSNERRYGRINLNNTKGTIKTNDNKTVFDIQICDISMEGLKIRLNAKLRKNLVYKIDFIGKIADLELKFENLNCVVSKTYVCDSGIREYGMTLFYPPPETKLKLIEYIKVLSSNVRINR